MPRAYWPRVKQRAWNRVAPMQSDQVGLVPGHLDMAWLAYRCTFVAYERRRLVGHTRTGPTLCGRLLRVQVVEWRTRRPPGWLVLLDQWNTRVVLRQLVLLGRAGCLAPAYHA